jgi:hypothetical protein
VDAVYSGQAGTLALLEGAEVRVCRAYDLESEFVIRREGAAYLFQGCTDIEVLRGVPPEQARSKFIAAWAADRALRLMLITLDPEQDTDLREEAADSLELLFEKPESRTLIENEFYSRAIPPDADIEFFSSSPRWPTAKQMLSVIRDKQATIVEHRRVWDSLPGTLFQDGEKSEFEERAIRKGAFRILASVHINAGNRNLAILECHRALSSLPNARSVVSE